MSQSTLLPQSPTTAADTDRPRVLEVLFSFQTGGSEVVGLELARELALGGVDVMCTSVTDMSGPLRERCAGLGIPVIDLGFPARQILHRNGFSASLTRRLKELRLSAIHLQHFYTLHKVGLAARIARVPRIVVTEHSDTRYREDRGLRLRLHLTWRLAHHITVIHEEMTSFLRNEIHIPTSRLSVIPNGIDVDHWHRRDREIRRTQLGIASEFVFMFVGRLQPIKNVPRLIRVFLWAQDSLTRPAKLFIVGDGPELAACKAEIAGHPMGQSVTFLGEQSDIRRFLAAADVLVLNSISEGVPRALLEAMCMGLPAISTGVGGIPALLRDRGWLTDVGDPESLRAALLEAAGNPENAAMLGGRGQAFVSREYDYREVLGRYRDVLGLKVLPVRTAAKLG